jgi:biotin-(acetyl-CoA carboxylase) ligase
MTSIRMETGVELDPLREFSYLLKEIHRVFGESTDFAVGEAERRLYRRGRRVSIVEGHPEGGAVLVGVLEGLGTDGTLLLRTDEGELHRIVSGEYSLQAE